MSKVFDDFLDAFDELAKYYNNDELANEVKEQKIKNELTKILYFKVGLISETTLAYNNWLNKSDLDIVKETEGGVFERKPLAADETFKQCGLDIKKRLKRGIDNLITYILKLESGQMEPLYKCEGNDGLTYDRFINIILKMPLLRSIGCCDNRSGLFIEPLRIRSLLKNLDIGLLCSNVSEFICKNADGKLLIMPYKQESIDIEDASVISVAKLKEMYDTNPNGIVLFSDPSDNGIYGFVSSENCADTDRFANNITLYKKAIDKTSDTFDFERTFYYLLARIILGDESSDRKHYGKKFISNKHFAVQLAQTLSTILVKTKKYSYRLFKMRNKEDIHIYFRVDDKSNLYYPAKREM